jgi:hypothetical protein
MFLFWFGPRDQKVARRFSTSFWFIVDYFSWIKRSITEISFLLLKSLRTLIYSRPSNFA